MTDSLIIATATGDDERVRLLLRIGADVNAEDASRHTPLHWAATRGHVEVVNWLVARGASLNVKDKSGQTPLHRASIKGFKNVVLALVQAGADLNARDTYGRTPLHWACTSGQGEVTYALIDAGADASIPDRSGVLASELASAKQHDVIADYVLRHARPPRRRRRARFQQQIVRTVQVARSPSPTVAGRFGSPERFGRPGTSASSRSRSVTPASGTRAGRPFTPSSQRDMSPPELRGSGAFGGSRAKSPNRRKFDKIISRVMNMTL